MVLDHRSEQPDGAHDCHIFRLGRSLEALIGQRQPAWPVVLPHEGMLPVGLLSFLVFLIFNS
jgi:hypothetical protein